jgi:hypothetical protein
MFHNMGENLQRSEGPFSCGSSIPSSATSKSLLLYKMKTALHTPGPWQVSPYGNITSKSLTVAKVEQMPGNYESEKQANALLIAAAPDLLSTLEAAYNAIAWDIPGGNLSNDEEETLLDAIREALRKAKGEA